MSDFLHKVALDSNVDQISGPLRSTSDNLVSEAAQTDLEVAAEKVSSPEPSPLAPTTDSPDARALAEGGGTSAVPAPEATVSHARTNTFLSDGDRADIEPAKIVGPETGDTDDVATPELRTEPVVVIERQFSDAPVPSEQAGSEQEPSRTERGVAYLTHIVERAKARGPALQSDTTFEPTNDVQSSDDVRGQGAETRRRITAIGPLIEQHENRDRPNTRMQCKHVQQLAIRADREDAPNVPARAQGQDSAGNGAEMRGSDVHIGRVDIYVEGPPQPAPDAAPTTLIDSPAIDTSAAYLRHL